MARPVQTRYRVKGTLVAESPLHVGAATEAIETDLPLAVDGAGDFYIPGTGLAGALRDWQRQAFDGRQGFCINDLWGYTPGRGDDPADGIASLVLVEDAKILDTDQAPPEIRDGVGIDRVEGRAADGIKYDRQVLPKGTRLSFEMTVEVPHLPREWRERLEDQIRNEKDNRPRERLQARLDRLVKALHRSPNDIARIEAALGHLIEALEKGKAQLGAAKTRGAGWVKLKIDKLDKQTLNCRDGILKALRGEGDALTREALIGSAPQGFKPQERPRLDITINWRPLGPVMVKADAEGVLVDMVPLVSATDGKLAPVIPGSSVKGALRTQAERIAATVLNKYPNHGSAEREEFLNLPGRKRFIDQLARCSIVETLFGAPGRREQAGTGDDSGGGDAGEGQATQSEQGGLGGGASANVEPPLPGRSALSVEDCYAKATIDRDTWRMILDPLAGEAAEKKAKDDDGSAAEGGKSMGPLMQLLKGETWEGFYPATHVAIDRWTGGAADGALYSVLEPPAGLDWPPIEMSVDLDRLADQWDARRPREKKQDWKKRVGERSPAERKRTRLAALALLFLTLRDLTLGRIPLGFGGNRGLGAIEVKGMQLRLSGDFDEKSAELGNVLRKLCEAVGPEGLTEGGFRKPNDALKETLEALSAPWRKYCRISGDVQAEVAR